MFQQTSTHMRWHVIWCFVGNCVDCMVPTNNGWCTLIPYWSKVAIRLVDLNDGFQISRLVWMNKIQENFKSTLFHVNISNSDYGGFQMHTRWVWFEKHSSNLSPNEIISCKLNSSIQPKRISSWRRKIFPHELFHSNPILRITLFKFFCMNWWLMVFLYLQIIFWIWILILSWPKDSNKEETEIHN